MCSPVPWPRCSPARWPIRSPPRWSPSRRRVSSGGWPSACRTGSAQQAATVCARGWPSVPLPRWLESTAVGGAPETDPWHPERAVWPLLDVLDAAADEPWCDRLHAHRDRRHALARRLAELFAAYATHRPALLRGWAAGASGDVDADLAWQPELWRRLRARIGAPDPAERVDAACAALRADPARGRAARAACRCSGPPGWPRRSSPCSPRSASTGRSTCGSPTPRPRSGPQVPPGGVPARAADPSAAPPRTRCSPPSGATCASCRCCSRPPCPASSTTTTRAPRPPATLLGTPAARPARRPSARHPPSRRPTTAPCRCTPATGRTARSRCCARSCSACSRPTRRSSRATSSSCAPTSRRSRR